MFEIHLGIPEMEELWNNLENKHQSGSSTKAEEKLRRQMGKAMVLLSGNPRHPGLHSHEISSLTARYGQKVWESYLENDTPKAGRIFWCYGPDKGSITTPVCCRKTAFPWLTMPLRKTGDSRSRR